MTDYSSRERSQTCDDPLAPARGILLGIGIGGCMWAAIWLMGRIGGVW